MGDKVRDTVDKFLTNVSENELINTPGMQPLRRYLLELALEYYQQFMRDWETRLNHYLAHGELLPG